MGRAGHGGGTLGEESLCAAEVSRYAEAVDTAGGAVAPWCRWLRWSSRKSGGARPTARALLCASTWLAIYHSHPISKVFWSIICVRGHSVVSECRSGRYGERCVMVLARLKF